MDVFQFTGKSFSAIKSLFLSISSPVTYLLLSCRLATSRLQTILLLTWPVVQINSA